MNDVEAEAILMALSAPLSWIVGRAELCAESSEATYTIVCRRGYYECRCSRKSRWYGDTYRWWHMTLDLALAQRACVWNVANGRWPMFWDEGWEHLKE